MRVPRDPPAVSESVTAAAAKFNDWKKKHQEKNDWAVAWTCADYHDFDTWLEQEVKTAVNKMLQKNDRILADNSGLKRLRAAAESFVRGTVIADAQALRDSLSKESTGDNYLAKRFTGEDPSEVALLIEDLDRVANKTAKDWGSTRVTTELADHRERAAAWRPTGGPTFDFEHLTTDAADTAITDIETNLDTSFIIWDNLSLNPGSWFSTTKKPTPLISIEGILIPILIFSIISDKFLNISIPQWVFATVIALFLIDLILVALSTPRKFLVKLWCYFRLRRAWSNQSETFREEWAAWNNRLTSPDTGGPRDLISTWVSDYMGHFYDKLLRLMPRDRIRLIEEDALVDTPTPKKIRNMLRGVPTIAIGLTGKRGSGKSSTLLLVTKKMDEKISQP
ncbi:MAG: hypothetical protein LBI84_02330, partial [Propionibacteriaceae bacterium]|nr:hypothetical protein [Propionibacteriaceae bacterium]